VSEREGRGFEEEGDEILKAGGEKREKEVRARLSRVQDLQEWTRRIGQRRRLPE
jgi:hypothetical protein